MTLALRILAALPALLFVVQGLSWLFRPAAAAQGLGMPLLEGVAASTQIGDFAAFFLVNGALMILGQLPGRHLLLYPPACMIGAAAVFRTLAALLGYADFAPQFIVSEIVMTAILLAAAWRLGREATER